MLYTNQIQSNDVAFLENICRSLAISTHIWSSIDVDFFESIPSVEKEFGRRIHSSNLQSFVNLVCFLIQIFCFNADGS